jgi:hypothetical protein
MAQIGQRGAPPRGHGPRGHDCAARIKAGGLPTSSLGSLGNLGNRDNGTA